MANRKSTLQRIADKAARRVWQQHLIYATREFGLAGERREAVCAAVADALGLPEPTTRMEGYAVLAKFYDQDPAHRIVSDATHGLKKQAKREQAMQWTARAVRTAAAPDVVSDAFLGTYEWRRLRMEVITERGARCECCGASPRDSQKVVINVDHIKPRRTHPELALTKSNLQILCSTCNHGKGSWDQTDWRADAVHTPAAMPRLVKR